MTDTEYEFEDSSPAEDDFSDVAEFLPPPAPDAPPETKPIEAAPKPRPDHWRCNGYHMLVRGRTGTHACNYRSPDKWRGACPGCGWYLGKHYIGRADVAAMTPAGDKLLSMSATALSQVKSLIRIPTGIKEFDHVLNGGVVLGHTVFLRAAKGTGKTTLLLQVCAGFARGKRKALFASAEMSERGVADYAKRLGIDNDNVLLMDNAEGICVEDLVDHAIANKCRLIVLDSLQVATTRGMRGDVGRAAAIDDATNYLTSFAQRKSVALVVIVHQNKSGGFAGTEKSLHLADVLMEMDRVGCDLEGDETPMRMLAIAEGKNRQGPVDVSAYLQMTPAGLVTPSLSLLLQYGLAKKSKIIV